MEDRGTLRVIDLSRPTTMQHDEMSTVSNPVLNPKPCCYSSVNDSLSLSGESVDTDILSSCLSTVMQDYALHLYYNVPETDSYSTCHIGAFCCNPGSNNKCQEIILRQKAVSQLQSNTNTHATSPLLSTLLTFMHSLSTLHFNSVCSHSFCLMFKLT